MKRTTFTELFKNARTTIEYRVHGLIIDITEQIVEKLKAMKMSKSDLASKMETTPPYITKLLRGKTNFTAESLVKVADSLNCDVRIRLVPRTCTAEWIALLGKSVETNREFRVWSQSKDDAGVRRDGLHFVQPLSVPQHFYHESH